MSRKSLLLAILASSVIFLISASAPSQASAANCTGAQISSIWWNQDWIFGAYLTGCTGTSGAALQGKDVGNLTRIRDNSTGIVRNTKTLTISYLTGSSAYSWEGPAFTTWGPGCPFTFSVSKAFGWRIRNAVGNTWGPWHITGYQNQMLC